MQAKRSSIDSLDSRDGSSQRNFMIVRTRVTITLFHGKGNILVLKLKAITYPMKGRLAT
jgi:hypothetical protein